MAVVMASSDMPEILKLSHRALVLREGRVVGELDQQALNNPEVQDTIFRLASGLTPDQYVQTNMAAVAPHEQEPAK